MEESKQETIADIVREMRKRAQEVYEGQAGYPESWEDQMNDDEIREIADRIEAAAKREREAGAEAAQICGEIGEMVGREAACKDSLQVGNAEKMREACENIAEYAKTAACHIEDIDDAHLLSYLNQIERWAESAISSPPRNCDVGTAEEQAARFDAQCRKHMGCLTCPFRAKDGGVHSLCDFAWSQMPYEKEVRNEKSY